MQEGGGGREGGREGRREGNSKLWIFRGGAWGQPLSLC